MSWAVAVSVRAPDSDSRSPSSARGIGASGSTDGSAADAAGFPRRLHRLPPCGRGHRHERDRAAAALEPVPLVRRQVHVQSSVRATDERRRPRQRLRDRRAQARPGPPRPERGDGLYEVVPADRARPEEDHGQRQVAQPHLGIRRQPDEVRLGNAQSLPVRRRRRGRIVRHGRARVLLRAPGSDRRRAGKPRRRRGGGHLPDRGGAGGRRGPRGWRGHPPGPPSRVSSPGSVSSASSSVVGRPIALPALHLEVERERGPRRQPVIGDADAEPSRLVQPDLQLGRNGGEPDARLARSARRRRRSPWRRFHRPDSLPPPARASILRLLSGTSASSDSMPASDRDTATSRPSCTVRPTNFSSSTVKRIGSGCGSGQRAADLRGQREVERFADAAHFVQLQAARRPFGFDLKLPVNPQRRLDRLRACSRKSGSGRRW